MTTTQSPFAGSDYDPHFDAPRLGTQLRRVFDATIDGTFRTLREISAITGDSEASISAQLRNLRKPEGGGHRVEKRVRGNRRSGLWEYRTIPAARQGLLF